MTFQTLLMFIFAPVLGLFVRIRAFAVVAALACAVCLPVGGSALAQSAQWGESAPAGWEVECVDDEWDDVRICEAFTEKSHIPLIAYHCKGTEKQSVLFAGGILLGELTLGRWEFTEPAFLKERLPGAFPDVQVMRKVQIRWDKEPVHEGILLSDANSPFGGTSSLYLYSWVWGKFPPRLAGLGGP